MCKLIVYSRISNSKALLKQQKFQYSVIRSHMDSVDRMIHCTSVNSFLRVHPGNFKMRVRDLQRILHTTLSDIETLIELTQPPPIQGPCAMYV